MSQTGSVTPDLQISNLVRGRVPRLDQVSLQLRRNFPGVAILHSCSYYVLEVANSSWAISVISIDRDFSRAAESVTSLSAQLSVGSNCRFIRFSRDQTGILQATRYVPAVSSEQ